MFEFDEEDDNGIYVELWQDVRLTEAERDALCEAADAGDHDEADRIGSFAYDRLFGETVN